MISIKTANANYYLFGSRTLTHVMFWLVYYVSFSLIWAENGNYYASFGLEFVLMPIRISASYLTIYFLIPRFLLEKKLRQFVSYLLTMLIIAGILQRVFIYFYYELIFETGENRLLDLYSILRAMILVNSTVLFLSAIKMYQHWQIEYDQNQKANEQMIEIRAEKRTYRVRPADITYIEGLGNYVTYYFTNRKPLISYSSLKDVEQTLPSYFGRIHKSFIVNKQSVESYTSENVEIQGRILPVGKSVDINF